MLFLFFGAFGGGFWCISYALPTLATPDGVVYDSCNVNPVDMASNVM